MLFLLFLSHSVTDLPFFQFFQFTVFLTIFVLKTVLINLFVDLAEGRIVLKKFLEKCFLVFVCPWLQHFEHFARFSGRAKSVCAAYSIKPGFFLTAFYSQLLDCHNKGF